MVWGIVLCVIFLIVLVFLFWFSDFLTKQKKSAGQKTESVKPAVAAVKETKSKSKKNKTQNQDDEFYAVQKELNAHSLADDIHDLMKKDAVSVAVEAEEQKTRPRTLSSRIDNIGRMRDYYEKKYGRVEERHITENYGFDDVYESDSDDEFKLNQEDVKKLLALHDMFEEKHKK